MVEIDCIFSFCGGHAMVSAKSFNTYILRVILLTSLVIGIMTSVLLKIFNPGISGNRDFILHFMASFFSVLIILGIATYYIYTRSRYKTFAEMYIENCSSGIIAIDSKENIVLYNQAAEDLVGIPKEELLEKPISELLQKKLGSYDSILLNTLRTGREYHHVEAVVDTSYGPLNVMAYTVLMRDFRGRIMGSLLSIRDITAQKQLETQIYQSEKFDLIGEIAAGIANEVRNPLTSLHGLLQLLENKISKEDYTHAYIRIMHEEINRLNFIISEFLLLSRPIVPIRQEGDLKIIIDEILTLVSVEAQNKNIIVIMEVNDALPKPQVDEEQIKHVFLNIITNAFYAMKNGGKLTIGTSFDEISGDIRITFTDTGVGMEPQIMDQIFEPFFTTKEGSTGLGLTVSKRIIHNHGGKILVDSKPGVGSVFTIDLPLY